jgi:hypothetical protein
MKYVFLSLVILCGLALETPTYAAVVSLAGNFSTLHVGDLVEVTMYIDTEREALNAFETTLSYPHNLLRYEGFDDGHSVLNLWVDRPHEGEDGQIHLSGITPGGFTDTHATLLSLRFAVIATGQDTINLADITALKHDGAGTNATISSLGLHVSVQEGSSTITMHNVDSELPEPFVPTIINDPDVFGGKSVLVFTTSDKGSGIDHYEVREGFFGRYTIATSPYEIRHQALDTPLYVKAVDRLGNTRVEILYPHNWRPWYKETQNLVTIVVICVLMLLGFSVWYKRRLR